MAWRQPIPTNLHEIFKEDHAANLLYRELLYRACNSDQIVTLGNKRVTMKRGQVIFGRKQYGKYLGWGEKKCARVLDDLQDFYQKVSNNPTPVCTVVDILCYDSVIGMEQQVNNSRTTVEQQPTHQSDTSKSVYIDKIEESERQGGTARKISETPLRPIRWQPYPSIKSKIEMMGKEDCTIPERIIYSWNEQTKLERCPGLNQEAIDRIHFIYESYGEEAILQALNTYQTVLADERYYVQTRYSLRDFFAQEKFLQFFEKSPKAFLKFTSNS